jgi:cation transport ATPase
MNHAAHAVPAVAAHSIKAPAGACGWYRPRRETQHSHQECGHARRNESYRAAAVSASSTHPLSRAIVSAAQARKRAIPSASDVENVPELGVRATVDGERTLIGNAALLAQA